MGTDTRLVFIGGGHSHAIALREWGRQPLENVDVTLISDVIHTPYSGMLPGYVAGFYDFHQTHIDLERLARCAGVRFCLDRAISIDLAKSQVICKKTSPITFDYLSIDIGSTPSTAGVIGAKDYAIAAKPVPRFLQAWQDILARAAKEPSQPLSIGIVGGGAGGVELALNMQAHLERLRSNQTPLGGRQGLSLHLIHRGQTLLPTHNPRVGHYLENQLKQRQIQYHPAETVREVQPRQILCASGYGLAVDYIIWVTSASAPSWIQASGLATDTQGFIRVDNTLKSLSHPRVFATGDIASIEGYPRPKAGVFAVRQGKPLWENLQRTIEGQPLKPYFPQQTYLSLIGTGDKQAIASWGSLAWASPLMWDWKDRIDRGFMKRFQTLA